MMSIIEGEVGAGKSFWATQKIAETLVDTRRPIFTNVPIYPHRLAAYCVFDLCGRSWLKKDGEIDDQTVALWRSFVRRLHYVPDERVLTLWTLPMFGAMIIWDELSQIFSSRGRGKLPEQINVWICQHRHARQDIYCMAQSHEDVHVMFRRHSTKLFSMRNGLGMSIWKNKYFQWMCWPVQFFKCDQWRMAHGKLVRKEGVKAAKSLWPFFKAKKLFDCYDSFSKPLGITCLSESVDGYDGSEDLAIWEEPVMMRIFKQLMANSTMVGLTLFMLVGGILGFRWLWRLANPEKAVSAPVAIGTTDAGGPRAPRSGSATEATAAPTAPTVVLMPTIDAVGLTVDSVILRNGTIWELKSWIVVGGLECGLVRVSPSERQYWWGVRDRTGRIVSASASQLSSGGQSEPAKSESR